MIGKITKGTRTGAIGAYLHGPGRANEHTYRLGGQEHQGGIVIGSNLPQVVGDTDSRRWAAELRKPLAVRERAVKQPIWQVSLALPPGERLTQAQWADAAQTFVEKLGVAEHPWVAVHHGSSAGGNDHIHIVLNRVNYQGQLWAAKQDYRQVQRAATILERQYGLSQAPRTRTTQSPTRTPKQSIHQTQREKTVTVAAQRAGRGDGKVAAPALSSRESTRDFINRRIELEVEKRKQQQRSGGDEPPKLRRGPRR